MSRRSESHSTTKGRAGSQGRKSDRDEVPSPCKSQHSVKTGSIRQASANETETLTRAIQGHDDALCDLLRILDAELRSHVTMVIGKRGRREIEVEDVVQVTYLEAFLRIRSFHIHGEGSFRAWLWRIAENNVKDALRVAGARRRPPPGKRITPENPEDAYVDLLIQMGGTQSTPSKLLARKEAKRVINEAIDRLPSDYGTVVRLCDLQGYSTAQAAAVMHRSDAAIRMLRARAHDRLADIVGTGLSF